MKQLIKTTEVSLLVLLEQEVRTCLETGSYNPKTGEYDGVLAPRDLAALGNLILNIQKRKDELRDKQDDSDNLVAFPAMPNNPNKLPFNAERFG